MHENKMMVIGTHICTATEDLYLLIDFLNRSLRDKNVVFGLAKNPDLDGTMMVTLYRTEP